MTKIHVEIDHSLDIMSEKTKSKTYLLMKNNQKYLLNVIAQERMTENRGVPYSENCTKKYVVAISHGS